MNPTPGVHKATVIEHRVGYATTGSLQIAVLFEYGECEPPAKIWGYIYMTKKAAGLARKSLKAIGFSIDEREFSELADDDKLLLGNTCEIETEEQTYNGKTQLKVKWINAPREKPEGEKAEKVYGDVTNWLRSAKKKDDEEPAVEPEGEDVPAPKGDDDIPF